MSEIMNVKSSAKAIGRFLAILLVLLMVVPSFSNILLVKADTTVTHDTDKDFKDGKTTGTTKVVNVGAPARIELSKNENWGQALPKTTPGKLEYFGMAYDSDTGLIVVFGGYDSGFNYKGDTWIYNASNNTWHNAQPTNSPPKRYGPTMIYDSDNKVMLLFGGYSFGAGTCGGYCSDTWAYNISNNTWFNRHPTGPIFGMYYMQMAYDPVNHYAVMFGGMNSSSVYQNKIWLYNYTSNAWSMRTPSSPPTARYIMNVIWNPINQTVMIFGGYSGVLNDDIWQYDVEVNTWFKFNPANRPIARYLAQMTWDQRLGKAFLFGGYSFTSGYLNDTWTFDPVTTVWTKVQPANDPGVLCCGAMVHNSLESVNIVFGGYGSGYQDKTWLYGNIFMTTGAFMSATIDSAPGKTSVNWINISAKVKLNEGNVSFRASANDDNNSWYFVGPDGTILTTYTQPDGETLWSGLDGKRYLRYEILLRANNPLRSPLVDSVTIYYNRIPGAPVLVSPSHFGFVTTNRPTFNLSSKELDNKDFLKFSIEFSSDNFNTVMTNFDQTLSTEGWSGAQFTSDEAALFTVPAGSELVNGKTYQWRARAFDMRDWSSYSVVWWFSVDTTPPEAPYSVSDGLGNDIAYTGSTTTLSAHWDSAGDPESGIKAYWYAIGTTPGGNDVLNFTDNGIRTAVTVSGLTLTQGTTYYFSVKAENGAEVFSQVVSSNGQTIDITAPTAPLVKDEGDYTNLNTELTAQWFSTDQESGIIENKYALGTTAGATDVVNWTSIGGANTITHSDLNLTEGQTYFFSVKSMNNVGQWSLVGSSDGITVDMSKPYDLSLSIVGAKPSTNSSQVSLWVGAKDNISGVSEMQLSNDGTVWSGWVPYGQTKEWALSSGDGPKTVYLQVKDKAGNIAGGASASILLDTAKPTGLQLNINGGAKYSNTTNAFLALTAYDVTSGVASMAFSQDGSNYDDWVPFAATTYLPLKGGDGNRQVYLRVKDAAGNEAGPVNASTILDTQAPSKVSVVINDNAAITKETQIWLKIAATDNTSGLSVMSISNDQVTWSSWEPYVSPKMWNLNPTIGVQTVYVKIKDAAGNQAAVVSDSIAYGENAMTLTVLKPVKSAKVSGTIKISGTAVSDTPVTSVKIRIDGGVWKDAQGGKDWSYSWNTKDYPDGVHTVEVQAQNSLGYTTSEPLEVKVSNKVNTTTLNSAGEVGALVLLIVAILVFALVIGFVIGRKPGKPIEGQDLDENETASDYHEDPAPKKVVHHHTPKPKEDPEDEL
jgi:hypothetical protein